MPRKIVQELQNDVDRLIQIGSGAISTDDGLKTRRAALALLVPKIPNFAPLLSQLEKAISAEPRQASIELLQLSAQLSVVRASLLSTNTDQEELSTLPVTTQLKSNTSIAQAITAKESIEHCNVFSLNLTEKRSDLIDLRMLSIWLQSALHPDKGEDYWEALAENFVGLDYFFRRDLHIEGDQKDALRLRLIANLTGKESEPLLQEAYQKGSALVQDAAFMAMTQIAPLEMEEKVLAALEEPSHHRQVLALRCLRYIPTERACNTLLPYLVPMSDEEKQERLSQALKQSRPPLESYVALRQLEDLERVAGSSLIRSCYPKLGERIVQFLLQNKEEINFHQFARLFQSPLSEELSQSIFTIWRRYSNYYKRYPFALVLVRFGTPSVIEKLFRDMPGASHSPNELLRELAPRLPNSGETFLNALFILVERFSASDRDLVYKELLGLNANVAVREKLMQRARSQDLGQREKNILQYTFEEIRKRQKNQTK
jgi:hypothetical protein